MKKYIFIIFFFIFGFILKSEAQRDYSTAIGFRMGPASGLTVKTFLSDRAAFEGLLSTRWRGFLLTGLYELHQDVFGSTAFNFYYGLGGHIGWWDTDKYDHPWWDDDDVHTAFGIDGIIGLEYTFEEIPFNISVDWKPMFTITKGSGFTGDGAGFAVRYTIK
jgi:hypothetical protein